MHLHRSLPSEVLGFAFKFVKTKVLEKNMVSFLCTVEISERHVFQWLFKTIISVCFMYQEAGQGLRLVFISEVIEDTCQSLGARNPIMPGPPDHRSKNLYTFIASYQQSDSFWRQSNPGHAL